MSSKKLYHVMLINLLAEQNMSINGQFREVRCISVINCYYYKYVRRIPGVHGVRCSNHLRLQFSLVAAVYIIGQ